MESAVIKISRLGFQWETEDPFLFCVHHEDRYPKGEGHYGPSRDSLLGRNIGNDFELRDGWRMYHGETVPGFPAHPHRGMETVTIVLEGFVDHSDSQGAAGRYGNGDVQWMTAGSGMQHAEMFPLLNREADNPLHLFQIWLNLPARDKFAEPQYKMLWAEEIPVLRETTPRGDGSGLRLIAGSYGVTKALAPPPSSWAHDPNNRVNIWLVTLDPGAEFMIPAGTPTTNRNLYYYAGDTIAVDGERIPVNHGVKLRADREIRIENGASKSEFLFLEGEPILEPVVQNGPFVMNTREEILQASRDFRSTEFGGWPWPGKDPVHSGESDRFARYADGRYEEPGKEGSSL